MDIASDEGESGLTMRRLADECGVTPMALYHHVADKEALLTAMVDRVVAEAIGDFGAADRDWRTDLVAFACRFRQGFVDHPPAAQVFLRRPILSPALARCTELMFASFARAGLAGPQLAEATDAVVLLVVGSISNDMTRPDDVRFQLADHIPEEDSPHLRSALDTYSRRDGEQRLRQALDWLLDGLLAAVEDER